jgi:hypothetical protein
MNDYIMWSPGVTLEQVEKQVILKALTYFKFNKTSTAQALGIAIRTLDARIEKYDMEDKDAKRREEERKRANEHFLARQRGQVPPAPAPTPASKPEQAKSEETVGGARLESTQGSTTEQPVPVSERKEVQKVLPEQAARNRNQRASQPVS